jgi:hypothetical protein
VLALAEPALDAQRPALAVHDDHRVIAIGLAGTAQILDLVTGTEHARFRHRAIIPRSRADLRNLSQNRVSTIAP